MSSNVLDIGSKSRGACRWKVRVILIILCIMISRIVGFRIFKINVSTGYQYRCRKIIIELYIISCSIRERQAILSHENVYASINHVYAGLLRVKEGYRRWSYERWMTLHEAHVSIWFPKRQIHDNLTIIEYKIKRGRSNRLWNVIELQSYYRKLWHTYYPRRYILILRLSISVHHN